MTSGPPGAPPISILGVGNVLLGDDGLGPHLVARLLARWRFAPLVEVVDLGTPGSYLVEAICGRKAVILLDALEPRGRPGRIRRVEGGRLLATGTGTARSAHDSDIRAALLAASLQDALPPHMVLWGAEAAAVRPRLTLSVALRAALRVLEEVVVGEIDALGGRPEPLRGRGPGPYSDRRATSGSTRVALRAGTSDAVRPVTASTPATSANTAGSAAFT